MRGCWGDPWRRRRTSPKPSPAAVQPGRTSKHEGATPGVTPDRITLTGRVFAPDGQPVPGTRVAVVTAVAQPHTAASDEKGWIRNEVLGSATADAEGRFRVDFPRIPPDRDYFNLYIGATGRALAFKEVDCGLANKDETITLEPERIFRGRFIDLQGQPIPGVNVHVSQFHQRGPYDAAGEAPPWPGPVTTDEQGRFTLRGLGRGATLLLEATSDRHAPQIFRVDPRDEAKTSEQTFALSPPQWIEVHVTRADDGKPVPGAWVNVQSLFRGLRRPGLPLATRTGARTDERGIGRINPWSGDFFWITVSPAAGQPYLSQRVNINWPKGAVRHAMEVKLKRGVSVHGTITEEASGQPVAGAFVVYFQTHRNNSRYRGFEAATNRSHDQPRGQFPDGHSRRSWSPARPGVP